MQVINFAELAGVTYTGRITLREARGILQGLGMEIRWLKESGEYRVNFQHGTEGTAYYTDCLSDALGTGIDMAGEEEDWMLH